MEEEIYNSALRFLSYRPRSEKEIRDYLINKISRKKALTIRHSGEEERRLQNLLATEKNGRDSGHGQNDAIASIIEQVIVKLKEQKFINDQEFAKWWIQSRLRFKPRSLRLIKLELRQKGISEEIVETIVNSSAFIVKSDFEQARKLLENRIGRLKSLPKQEIYQKLGRFLASKGFDWETIKQSIDEVLKKGV